MNFNRVAPCGDCPFRSDIEFHLHPNRRKEIANDLVHNDKTFACHKTVDYDVWAGDGEYQATGNESHCAGALISMKKGGTLWHNWRLRFAKGIGLFDDNNLRMSAPVMGMEEFECFDQKTTH